MTLPGNGWFKKDKEAKKERLREVLRKDPYVETKLLVERFGLSRATILKIRKEIYKELGIKPLNSPYITLKESRKAMPEVVHPWRRKKKLDK